MRTKLLVIAVLLMSTMSYAQDTTWVQTFTFDSITSRRADFIFPQTLNDKRFERVLMYFKLKCDAQTTWDQYACGEWDYLTYSKIFDHTGELDSVQVDNDQYINNYMSTPNYVYENYTGTRVDEYVSVEQTRIGAAVTNYSVLSNSGSNAMTPFDMSVPADRFQMLITAAELWAVGILPGDIEALSLYVPVGGIIGSGELFHPSISIKGTADNTLTAFQTTGFTEVYNLSMSAGAGGAFVDGENTLLFYQPYTWNGTDNLVLEFYYDRSVTAGSPLVNFEQNNSVANMAVAYGNRNGVLSFDGGNHALFELSDVNLGNDVTIAFWAQGLGNTGMNTSILEAYDTLNNRVINIHMPWSNNRIYWDAGQGSGYDRIDKDMNGAGIDNEWHHWAFIKSQGTGEMKIMRDGVLWHSGTGLTLPVGYLHRLVIGSNRSLGNHWKGQIDEFQLFNVAVSEADITGWYKQEVTATHPNWANLMVYYSFDETSTAVDGSGNNVLLMPSEQGMMNFSQYPLLDPIVTTRPAISLSQGFVPVGIVDVEVPLLKLKEPEVVFEYAVLNDHFEIVNAFLAMPEGSENVYDVLDTLITSSPFAGTATLNNSTVTYYQAPFEIVKSVEIGRYITPYGIQFDLGSGGFEWLYDVTDYQMYLHDTIDFACHNTQELIDIRFAFIEGIPPRDVHNREPIWSDMRSYNYGNMANDVDLQNVSVVLSDTSEMFRIKTRLSGHGQVGNGACCEWAPKDHKIIVNGVERFNWDIWEETACGDNPNVSQGGTWPYAREGWCPGDVVKEYNHELTPYVNPGDTVQLDYDITDIPVGDPGQGGGNYIVALDLISYSAPNFQNDAAVIDIYNPNSWEYYRKWNPSCQNPRIVIQNTGEQVLTSARVTVWIDINHMISFDWTGSLSFLDKAVVEIPIPDYTFWFDYGSSGTFSAHIDKLNGVTNLDEYAQNDEITIPFKAPEQMYFNGLPYQGFLVWFQTNNKAYENKWKLMDSDGNTIFERTTLQNSTDYKDTFNLAPGCYSILLEDNDNDGISFWYSAQQQGETSGSFSVKLVGGPIIENFEKDFGNFNQYNFTVGFNLDVDELVDLDEDLKVYPNPNNGLFNIELIGNVDNYADLEIYDIMGRKVHSEKMIANLTSANSTVNLENIPAGHYVIKVITPNGAYTQEFVKQ